MRCEKFALTQTSSWETVQVETYSGEDDEVTCKGGNAVSFAMLHAYTAYDFKVSIKMDTDALLTGLGWKTTR